jgi:hypothetical protein
MTTVAELQQCARLFRPTGALKLLNLRVHVTDPLVVRSLSEGDDTTAPGWVRLALTIDVPDRETGLLFPLRYNSRPLYFSTLAKRTAEEVIREEVHTLMEHETDEGLTWETHRPVDVVSCWYSQPDVMPVPMKETRIAVRRPFDPHDNATKRSRE